MSGAKRRSGRRFEPRSSAAQAPVRRRAPLVLAVGAGAAAIVGGIAIAAAGSGDDGAADASEGPTATTRISRRDLVEVQTEDGTLGYADSRTVVNRMAGTITWLPRTGTVVRGNGRLYAVDGKAVYLLDGSTPAYRALAPGISGKDVGALERNLRALGKDPSRAMTPARRPRSSAGSMTRASSRRARSSSGGSSSRPAIAAWRRSR